MSGVLSEREVIAQYRHARNVALQLAYEQATLGNHAHAQEFLIDVRDAQEWVSYLESGESIDVAAP